MKNALKPSAKSILVPLGLKAAASVTDAAIQKKIFGSGMSTLIISNEEMDDMKTVKSLKESGLLIKGVTGLFRRFSVSEWQNNCINTVRLAMV